MKDDQVPPDMLDTIITGDCLEVMKRLPDGCVDAVITDPPYDAKTHTGARYGFRDTSSKIPFPVADVEAITPPMIAASNGWVLAFCALEMYGTYRDAAGDGWVRAGFWRRTNGVPQFTGDRPGQPGEGIAIMHSGRVKKAWNGHGRHGFWEYPIVCGGPHPTTKPLPLMEHLLQDFTSEGDTILDPFCGSGTTCVAAKRLGRHFIGIEIDPGYAQTARNRLRDTERPLFQDSHG